MTHVYELRNSKGIVEYVGETKRPNRRFKEHILYYKNSRFFGRKDLIFNIVDSFIIKKEAYQLQCRLQKEYGIVSDKETAKNNGYKSINSKAFKPVECPHCKRTGPYSNWIQHHFDNCKHKNE